MIRAVGGTHIKNVSKKTGYIWFPPWQGSVSHNGILVPPPAASSSPPQPYPSPSASPPARVSARVIPDRGQQKGRARSQMRRSAPSTRGQGGGGHSCSLRDTLARLIPRITLKTFGALLIGENHARNKFVFHINKILNCETLALKTPQYREGTSVLGGSRGD